MGVAALSFMSWGAAVGAALVISSTVVWLFGEKETSDD